jgi:RHS repeat-associated protein
MNLPPTYLSCSGKVVQWTASTNNNFTGQENDTAVYPPCKDGTPNQDQYSGPSSGGLAGSGLSVDVTTKAYAFGGDAGGLGTLIDTQCGTPTPSPIAITISPFTNYPPSFTLPATVQPLSVTSYPFQAQDTTLMMSIPWTLSFTVTPTTDCEECKKKGGAQVPISSSLSAQNQSLGEDLPVVGTGFTLHYESGRAPGSPGNIVASTDAAMIGGWTLSVHHAYDSTTHTLFLGDGGQRNGSKLGNPIIFNKNTLITSEDGSEVYVFSPAGRHLQTLRPLTGALKYKFGYDAAGNLITVTDAKANVTTIQRNATEQATGIVAPFGQTTALAVDGNGFLSKVTDPLGKSSTFVNGTTGLLSSRTDQNGNISNYTYDTSGRLSKDADPLGGFTQLNRIDASTGLGWSVDESTSMGRTTSYQDNLSLPWIQDGTQPESEQHLNTWPDGLLASSSSDLQNGQLTNAMDLPDGTSVSETLGPDPVWGLQSPVYLSGKTTQGNLTMNTTGSATATLGTAGDPFTVTTETNTQTVNGRTYTSTFTGATRTYVNTSPVGRTLTIGLDALERIANTQVEGLTAADYSYDTHGRLASITQGTRKTTFSYNTQGFLAGVTDPLTHTTSFSYDADGHILDTTLPDSRVVTYTYDANGNLTSVTPPGKLAHDFTFNAVNLPESYTPPAVTGTGATSYSYNLDRDLTTITRPDGKTIAYGYDSAGRLISITTPTGKTIYTYSSTTGNLASAARGTQHIAYGYNGPLPTKSTWTGTVAGSVSRTYNNNFWIASQQINGANTVAILHDNDGLVTKAGAMAIRRSAKNGLISGTTLGVTTDARTYNTFGELTGYTAAVNGTTVYSVVYTRDSDSRVASKTETIAGASNAYSYTYDLAGRLANATKNGATNTYTYDTNSNRLTGTTSAGTSSGTYDAQDRMLTYGNATYTYTANGELMSQTVGSQKTTYVYDVLGNLTGVTLPNGTKIAYIVDAENHRVGREVNGVLQTGFLYDGNRIAAQLNGSNQLVSQFVYGTSASSPDYMVSGGVTYRIFSDQLGSPILIVNTTTGAIAEQITYDEFGNILTDTSPGFQPFGFAGGLYDQDTKLLRFGARDYNPATGRWTAKDPILFDGGSPDLYEYVVGDPINRTDPKGLQAEHCACSMAKPLKPYKPKPFVDYTPGPEEIQAILQAAAQNLVTPVVIAPPHFYDGPGVFVDTGARSELTIGEVMRFSEDYPGATKEMMLLNLSNEEVRRWYEQAEAVGSGFGGVRPWEEENVQPAYRPPMVDCAP